MTRDFAVCFLRVGTEILLVRGAYPDADGIGLPAERWGVLSAGVGGDPKTAARRAVEAVVSDPSSVSLLERGDPVVVAPNDDESRLRLRPFLFECSTRDAVSDIHAEYEWCQPPRILDRETVAGLWEAYLEIAPSVETVRGDEAHGAAYISVRALEILRDSATTVAAEDGDYRDVEAIARAVTRARPTMGVVENRINRVMASADETAKSVRDRAMRACVDAIEADGAAAERAASLVGSRVLTLSRSGTVLEALEAARPEIVFVAESRPGREGIATAEALAAAGIDVTVLSDSAVGSVVASDVDTVLVGSDSVLGDGRVVNKVGTHNAASAAAESGTKCVVVCSRDKIVPRTEFDPELGPPEEIRGDNGTLPVYNPTFEAVPAALVSGIATEDGVLSGGEVEDVAAEHAALARWDEDRPSTEKS